MQNDTEFLDAYLGPVRRVAVLRALGLGDLICATPALRALRQRFPQAGITLVGLPWAREWVARSHLVDEHIEFPGHPALPERAVDQDAWPDFLRRMRAGRLDLAVQLHGSGRVVNGLVAQWGARRIAAFHEPGRPAPDARLSVPWPDQGPEVSRLLRLPWRLGAAVDPGQPQSLVFDLTRADREAARALVGACRPYVCVHPGAQLPSRRWPAQRFAEVARGIALQGRAVVLTGVAGESDLARQFKAALAMPCVDLVGRTTLGTLGAVIEGADLLLSNDTGVSHMAAALKTPSVVVSCGSDVGRWAPADGARHQMLWRDLPCRPCAHARCPTAHECADQMTVPVVARAVQGMLFAPHRGPELAGAPYERT